MKILRAILNFYIQSSMHVALAVTALAVVSVMQYGFVPEPVVLAFIFFGTITGYNFVKYAGISNQHNLKITPNINLIRGFSVLCLIPMGYFGLKLPANVLLVAAIFGGLTLLYALPLYKSRNLRGLSGAKIYIIALVWVGVTVLLPLEYHNMAFRLKILYQCLEIFFFVIALTLPFEIRDLKYDEKELGTIPQKLGIRKTKWLGTALLILMAVLTSMQTYVIDAYPVISYIIVCITIIAVWGAKENQNKYYASLWVESIPILWLILLLIA